MRACMRAFSSPVHSEVSIYGYVLIPQHDFVNNMKIAMDTVSFCSPEWLFKAYLEMVPLNHKILPFFFYCQQTTSKLIPTVTLPIYILNNIYFQSFPASMWTLLVLWLIKIQKGHVQILFLSLLSQCCIYIQYLYWIRYYKKNSLILTVIRQNFQCSKYGFP